MSFIRDFERLFQLEFFVNYVKIQSSSLFNVESTICVSFQFLQYPNMRMCEEEFSPKNRPLEDSKIIFKSGKSCLFSVHSDDTKRISPEFNLVITVCQSVWCSNERQLVGTATVNLGKSFLNLLTPPADLSTPACSVQHDAFPLKDEAGNIIGSVAAFARITCYGKLIITSCQMGAEDELNFMFQGVDPSKIFYEDEDMDYPNIDYAEEEYAMDTPYEDIFGYPKESEAEFQDELLDEEEGEGEDMEGIPDAALGEGGAKDKSREDENYKEIGAKVNGHTIIIRVLKKRKRTKKKEDTDTPKMLVCCCPPEPPPVCPNAPKLNVCDCDFPLPDELIPRCPTQCCPPPCPPPSCPCCPPVQPKSSPTGCPKQDCPMNSFQNSGMNQPNPEPGTVVMKGDDVFYQSLSKKGEPLKNEEKEIADSLYYNTC